MSFQSSVSIAKLQFVANLLSIRFALMIALSVGLVATSVFVLVVKYRQLLDEVPMREKQHREEVDTYGSQWDFMQRGLKIEKRPNLLAVFGEGASGRLGRTLQVPGESYQTAGAMQGNPLFQAFESLDLVFVVKVILSLAALLIAYDLVSGEKAQGTLKLLLSNPVARDEVLLGKLMGATASLALPLLFSFAAGGLVLWHLEKTALTGYVWQVLGVTLLAGALYLMVFLTLGLLVSCATTHPDSSLLWLLFCWVLFVFALPSAGLFLAEVAYRIQPDDVIQGRIRAVWSNNNYRWRAVRQKRRSVWRDLPSDERRQLELEEYDAIMEDSRQEVAKIHEGRRQELIGQMQFARVLSAVSPASSFETIATGLLGTDYAAHVRFLDAGREYGEELQEFLRRAFRERMETDELKEKVKAWRAFSPPSPEAILHKFPRMGLEILVLVFFNVIFFMLAHGLFLRYDPT